MKHTNFLSHFAKRAAILAGAVCLVAGAAQAQTKTDAGTAVGNTFTLDYDVSGTPQPTITNDPDTPIPGAVITPEGVTYFTVDRLIDLTLTETNSPLSVSPGQGTDVGATVVTDPALTFSLVNTGNDNQAYTFSLADVAGDDFDAAAYQIAYFDGTNWVDVDPVAPGTATPPAGDVSIDVAAGATLLVRVSSVIGTGLNDGDIDSIRLTAETRDPTAWAVTTQTVDGATVTRTASTPGAVTGAAAGANALEGDAQNVLADAATDGNTANDGLFFDEANYVISAPELTAVKSVTVVGGGFAVPGATVEYQISVTNAATGSAPATNITISDDLPDDLTWVSSTVDAGFTTGTLTTADGATACTTATPAQDCTVTLTGGTLPVGNTGVITIRATVK